MKMRTSVALDAERNALAPLQHERLVDMYIAARNEALGLRLRVAELEAAMRLAIKCSEELFVQPGPATESIVARLHDALGE